MWTNENSYSSSSPLSLSDLSSESLYPLTHFMDYNKFLDSHRHFLVLVTAEVEPFYPLTYCMDYNKFFYSHPHFLAWVTAEVEPTKYYEAVSNPN